MSICEPLTLCGCNLPDCWFCNQRKISPWLFPGLPPCDVSKYKEVKMTTPEGDTDLTSILNEVSVASGVKIEDIAGRSRREEFVIPRQFYCYLARKKGKWKDRQIGSAIGYDRCTVIHSCGVIEDMLEMPSRCPKYKALAQRLGII